MPEKGNNFSSLLLDLLNHCTSIELATLLHFVLRKVMRLLLWWGLQNAKWKLLQFNFCRKFCHESLTNCPWRKFISSPFFSLTTWLIVFCMIRDIWNCSDCLLPTTTISVCVHKNKCGHKGKQVREGKRPPLVIQSGSEVTAESPVTN